MRSTMNLEEHKAMKEKRVKKKLNSKDKSKYTEQDDMSVLLKRKVNKGLKNRNTDFRNNYKNYQYDYEEDFYEPRY